MKWIRLIILFLISAAGAHGQSYNNLNNVVIDGSTGHSVTQLVTNPLTTIFGGYI